MTMADLYEDMKEAIRFFGLRFHQMDEIQVEFKPDGILFTWHNKSIVVKNDDS